MSFSRNARNASLFLVLFLQNVGSTTASAVWINSISIISKETVVIPRSIRTTLLPHAWLGVRRIGGLAEIKV